MPIEIIYSMYGTILGLSIFAAIICAIWFIFEKLLSDDEQANRFFDDSFR
jgi:hypothetical protein